MHDGAAEPLFFVTSPINQHLLALIEQDVLPQVRRQIGPQRTLTLVFDREAWSPKSFQRGHTQGVEVITYCKGKQAPWDPQDFQPFNLERNGQSVTYWLAERSVQVLPASSKRPAFWMPEIRRLSKSGHQTAILTTRRDVPAAVIADHLFARHDDEARAFLKSVFRLPGDIIPDHERHELRVRLYGLANNRSQQALIALCECLNTQQALYPGTELRFVFEAIQSH